MKYKKIFVLTIFLVSLLAVSAVNATDNATNDVVSVEETTVDVASVDDDQVISANNSDVGTFDDLANEINAVEERGVLNLTKDYKYVNGSTDGITINKAITIDGQGHTLDGNKVSRIIIIYSKNILLKNIIFINGRSEDGGAIINKCSLVNCTFINNSAGRGGALYSCDAVNCSFINNTARNYGGAIFRGSATNCTFVNNSALYGGAISGFKAVSAVHAFAINCTFLNNHGKENGMGGATYYCSSTNCIFVNNTGDRGGAISGGSAISCVFVNNSAIEHGGAIYSLASDANYHVASCVFVNNSAGHSGGAIYYLGSDANYHVASCVFVNNSAIQYGGAMYQGSATNCNFTNNFAGRHGGAMYQGSATSCIFENNFVNTHGGAMYEGSATDCVFVNNSATHQGGASYRTSSTSCIFVNNAAKAAGAMYEGSATDCVFVNNTATNGGAICRGSATNCNFTNNSATYQGGASYRASVINCVFVNNTAEYGGAICEGSAKNFTFINNSAITLGNDTYKTTLIQENPIIQKIKVKSINYMEDLIINFKCNVDGVAIIKIGETYIKNITVVANNITSATFYGIPAGDYDYTITLKPNNNNYAELTTSPSWFTVFKKHTNVTLNVIDSIFGEDVVVNVTASENGNVILNVGNITRTENVLANIWTTINLGVLSANLYDANVSFNAGPNYEVSTQQKSFIITPAKSEIVTIEAQNNIYGQNTIINVKTNVEGILSINIDNNLKTFNISANKLTSFDLGVHDVDTYDVNLSLDAGSNYTKSTGNTKVTIKPKQTTVTVNADNGVYENNMIVKVIASENGKVTVNVGTNIRTVDVEANKVTLVDFGILDVNSYEVNATFDGGKNYQISFDKTSLVVSPKTSTVNLVDFDNSYVYSQNVIIKMKTNADGTLTVKVGGKSQSKQVSAGNVVSFDFGILDVDNYDVKISLDAENNYISSKNSTSIIVAPKSTSITLNTKNYNDDENVIVNVTASENGCVTIKLGSYIKTVDINANVIAFVDFGILDVGSYNVIANFTAGNNYIDSTAADSVNVLFKIKDEDVNITIPEIKPNQENNITINLPADATGTVTLTINGKEYYFDVVKGAANVNIPDLSEGNYPYTITYSGDSKYSSFTNNGTLNKAAPAVDPVITASNVKVTYATGKYYTIKVYDADGKLANGVTVKITGKIKKTLTTKDGVAKFKVSNVPGTYKIKISALGKSVTKTLTVKHLVTLKSVTVKKSAKKLTLQATLSKVNGKYLKNKKITFKFNGKKYSAKTNKKGVAKVTIKSSVLKKLKVGKKVTYQATYSKDTVKKTVKIKK